MKALLTIIDRLDQGIYTEKDLGYWINLHVTRSTIFIKIVSFHFSKIRKWDWIWLDRLGQPSFIILIYVRFK